MKLDSSRTQPVRQPIKTMNNEFHYVEIAFPIPIRTMFTYSIPSPLMGSVQPGCRVYAPFGKQKRALGFVYRLIPEPDASIQEIKPIVHLVDEQPLFGDELRRFLDWVADYYLVSVGETYSAAYPFSPAVRARMIKVVALVDEIQASGQVPDSIRHDHHRKVIEYLINRKALLSPTDIVRELGISTSMIKTLEKNGWVKIETREKLRMPVYQFSEPKPVEMVLTDEQRHALSVIQESLRQASSKPILLHGVTGSGKTEIYLQAIQYCLQMNKSALVLIPEISLTPQTMDRFRSRFGDEVGILHSALGQGERYDEWRLIKQQRRKIVVGTRSAIFAPLENPGIIIVDEEHDGSYKQSDPNPRYNGRDLAVARAYLCRSLCILGSATPAIESAYNVQIEKYVGIRLQKRVSSHGLPSVQLLDMRGRIEDEEILTTELLDALWDRFEKKQQSILFLNRRGFATTLICNNCGHILVCDHCSVAMVYHRSDNRLICHHCDHRKTVPHHCPSCQETFIRQRGFGTEKVVDVLQEKIPEIRIIRMDRDTTRQKGDHDRLLTPFREGQADVLVGTQMIAKGLDFPNVTLVGIINADYALSLPDFRAAERTFTLLTQVAGRSGRGTQAGDVYVQTYCPDHYSIQLAIDQNYDSFYEKEIRYRRLIGFPPFTRLVLWRIESTSEDVARGQSWELYTILSQGLKNRPGITLLPPVEAPLYRLRDYYRWQVALKSRDYRAYRPLLDSEPLQKFLSQRKKNFRIVQDVDPYDML